MARRRELSAEEAELCLPSPTPPHEVWLRHIDTYLRTINYRGERIDGADEEDRDRLLKIRERGSIMPKTTSPLTEATFPCQPPQI
jgi:hypothetical protein